MFKSIPKTLLVVKNRALGDSIMTLGTIRYLKKILPNTKVIYAVPRWIEPLYEDVETCADKIIALDLKNLKDWYSLYKQIKHLKVDTVLELFQSGRTSKAFTFLSKLGLIDYYFHNHHHSAGPVYDQGVIKSNIQRDLDAAFTFFSKTQTPPNFLDYPPQIKKAPKSEGHYIFGVVATRQTKMWPLKFYARLSHLIKEKNPKAKIVIPLGPSDGPIEDAIIKLNFCENTHILKSPLSELPHNLSGACQYIGNDTGLKHLSVALGIPTFTLFGPEPPKEWHPYDKKQHPYYFREPLECRTRHAHYCGLSTCDSMICLNTYTPEELCRDQLII